MLQRIASSRQRLEEMAEGDHRPTIPILLMGLVPAIVIVAVLALTGVIPTPLSSSRVATLVQATTQSSDPGEKRAEHTVQDWAQQLGSAITSVREDAQRISSQLQRSRDALQAEKADLASLQSMLDQLKRDVSARQSGNLEVKKGALDLRYRSWQQSRAAFQDAISQLKSTLAQVDAQTSAVQQLATALDDARWRDPLAGVPSPAPGDEQEPLQQYQSADDEANRTVPGLESDDAGFQKAADSAIAEAHALGAAPQPEQIGAAMGFIGGFADLAGRIPDVAGKPTEPEQKDPNSGDTVQHTSRGMMVWRKADNWIAFTDGSRSWIMGPQGLQVRDNNRRFDWEKKPGN